MFIDSQIGALYRGVMMLRRIKISLISLLMFGVVNASVADSDSASLPGWHHGDAALRNAISQRGLFDGVKLTEQQRQHMRDLMQQARQDAPVLHFNDIEKMHTLVTAEKFDEAAVRKQISQMMQAQVERQIEMTRVRNQMYNLLNSEQKSVLEQRYQQRMNEMRQQLSQAEASMSPLWGAEQ